MATLVEDVVSLEKEANAVVTQAHAEAKELEKLAVAEADAFRRKLGEETEQKILAFQKEAEERYEGSVAETEKDLTRRLSAIDEIDSRAVKEQIEKIVTQFGEL